MRLSKAFLVLGVVTSFAGSCWAEEGIYNLSEIDYFNMKGVKKTDTREIRATVDKKSPPIDQSLWIEPAVSADGKVSYYKPPQVVIDFLDDPTRENGMEYLKWNQQRLAKVDKAQAVLQDLAREMNLVPPAVAPAVPQVPQAVKPAPVNIQKNTFVGFFLLYGCPYCEKQKELIADLFKTRPDLHIEVYLKNYPPEAAKSLPFLAKDDNGLSRQLGLNSFPSVFVANKYGKKMIIPGLIEKPLLLNLLEQKV